MGDKREICKMYKGYVIEEWCEKSLLFGMTLIMSLSLPAFGGENVVLQPFASDGCSAFPDGSFKQNELWLSCCIEHDKAYWLGGEYHERQIADNALKQCVADIGEPEIALIMLTGVRVGGSPFWHSPFRWGYGWPYWNGWLPRGYRALSDGDRKLAKDLQSERLGESIHARSEKQSE